ncbi:hypothetical protein DTO96_102532 [Ephemeroptericola cinctiostellae]|uniref:Bacteriophage Mu Gp45 N-terminal domain-containing protein n=1 Tax=Ephemeroptericola cinctiostellae TaxID=2268024 RepID=A0A345DEI8_9BURK|nr:phage baseplate assembly protein V [Ephemeroptericola cinctiostellae]AXF86776.1 hypothetical protein DTO96_102532 [Ephemeroptericola cinctiostellae]
MMHRLAQRMRLMVARGVVNLINDAGGLQMLQIDGLDGETRDDVERVQNFGHTSHPPRGSTPIMVAVAGSRDHLVAVAVDNEDTRPRSLSEGESALYNAHGVMFLLDKDGNAVLTAKKLILNIETLTNNATDSSHAGTSTFDNPIDDNHRHTEHDGGETGGPHG